MAEGDQDVPGQQSDVCVSWRVGPKGGEEDFVPMLSSPGTEREAWCPMGTARGGAGITRGFGDLLVGKGLKGLGLFCSRGGGVRETQA